MSSQCESAPQRNRFRNCKRLRPTQCFHLPRLGDPAAAGGGIAVLLCGCTPLVIQSQAAVRTGKGVASSRGAERMDEDDPVTRWIEGLKAGDEAAVADLWNRYFDRLVHLARQKLGTTAR